MARFNTMPRGLPLALLAFLTPGLQAFCDAGWFGKSCRYSCNCQVECDQDTGACPGNCSAGWVKGGQLCQKKNIAYKKTASSTTNTIYPIWSPKNAVDGNNNIRGENDTCFHGDYKRNELTIDLGKVYKLYHMRFYIRYSYQRRMSNSLIYLDGEPSKVCYTFPPSLSNNPFDVVCEGEARRLTIENPGTGANSDTPLNICEVEIYNCSPGTYGENCTDFCHCSGCDVRTGVCTGDCFEGWQGDRCDIASCDAVRFGESCRYFCNCQVECDQDTGACPGNCSAGWVKGGQLCQKQNIAYKKTASSTTNTIYRSWSPGNAVDGNNNIRGENDTCFHGDFKRNELTIDLGKVYKLYHMRFYIRYDYEKRMSNSLIYLDGNKSRVCYTFPPSVSNNPTDVVCEGEARRLTIENPGTGANSDTPLNICEVEIYHCSPGTYGENCTDFCHCSGCDVRTGVCNGDCFEGWHGDRCDRECSRGTYGKYCTNLCHCSDCDVRTGVCTEDCFEGWQGDRCDIECSRGTYGKDCTNLCHCSDCDVRTGVCTEDCFEGWQGDRCDIECSPGTYGKNCTNLCHCSDCDARTGVCNGDCFEGWQGNRCDIECSPGTYGKNCTNLCHCSDCDTRTGVCTGDCFEGWQGDRCNKGDFNAADSSKIDIRTIVLSTTVGVLVVIIVVLTVVIIRMKRRQHSSGKTSEGDNTTVPGPNPTQDPVYTDVPPIDTNRSSTLANYERFQFTEDNLYTGLQGRNPYENI